MDGIERSQQRPDETPISIEQYLEQVGEFSGDAFGGRLRAQFADISGDSELAMLVSPSRQELEQLARAVAIMTPREKQKASQLTDDEIARIADDAGSDPGLLAIFFNGYALYCKRVSRPA